MLHLNLPSLLSFWNIHLQLFFGSTLIYPYWCYCWNKWYVYGDCTDNNDSDRDSVGYRSSQRCCCRITRTDAATVDTSIIRLQGPFRIGIASKFFPSVIYLLSSWRQMLWCFRLLYGTTKLWWSQKRQSYDKKRRSYNVSDSCMVL